MTPGPDPSTSPTTHSIVQPPGKCRGIGGRDGGGSRHVGFPSLLPYLTSNSRNSMSITNTKGLLNMPGQNNCFLNSAVQVLWHLDIFRRSFRELSGHACMAESCIFCALKELFAQFQYSQESALPPDALRRALAETFCDQRRFQLGFMDDAAECFENILLRIHFHIANKESEDMCSASHCIPHQKFAMTLVEQTVCHACGATSEPLPFTQMVHYVPSSALCSQAKVLRSEKDEISGFGELLKRAGSLGDLRDCPSACGAVIHIRKTLMNRPEIVSIGLVWDSEHPTIDHIMDVFSTIGMTLKLQDVFHSVVDSRWASTAAHQLVGIVTYYGKHYSTFFFHTKLRVWIYFDDAAVREIGPKWEQVVQKCCRGHFQPLLLLYANPYGTSISTTTAPHDVTFVASNKKVFSSKDAVGMKVTEKFRPTQNIQNADNQRRAMTPNPEASCDVSANIQPRRAVTPSGDISHVAEAGKDALKRGKNCFEKGKPYAFCENDILSHARETSDQLNNASDQLEYRHDLWRMNQFSGNADGSEDRRAMKDKERLWSLFPHGHAYKSRLPDSTLLFGKTSEVKNNASSHLSVEQPNSSKSPNPDCNQFSVPSANDEMQNIRLSNSYDDERITENTYISRRAVENVLHLQKLQRQKSVNAKNNHIFVGQRNSNSSLESLENIYVVQDKDISNFLGLKFDIPESINIPRRRDSGNWSGDRNSASSSSTTSLDNPYFYAVGNKRSFCNGRIIGRSNVTESTSTDPGYDSFSLSSSDSYPSVITFCPGKVDPRLGQILENQQSAFIPYDVSQLQHCVQDLSKSSENHIYGFRDECEKLCIEADIFLAKSVERENIGDISMAVLLSDSAAAKARAAMDVPYSSPHSLSLAKLKHSMCIIRSCNLQKKLKEALAAEQKREFPCKYYQNHDSSQEIRNMDANVFKKGSSTDKHTHQHIKSSNRSIAAHKCVENTVTDCAGKAIEIYATLPKKNSKKKSGLLSFVESFTGEDSMSDKSSKQKNDEQADERSSNSSDFFQSDGAISPCKNVSSDTGSIKSQSNRKKCRNIQKITNKDSDLSDYSSEWELTKKSSLYRTYSGPPLQSKNVVGDNSDENQALSCPQTKKQHRIRRKLIGGFMRRKNRSLPDLREGQDQSNDLSRAYDDCAITKASMSLKILCDKSHNSDQNILPNVRNFPQKLHKQTISDNLIPNRPATEPSCEDSTTNSTQNFKHLNPSSPTNQCFRAHTPPPYKPPPPIAGSGLEVEAIRKKLPFHNKDNKQLSQSLYFVQANISARSSKDEQLKTSGNICARGGYNSQNIGSFVASNGSIKQSASGFKQSPQELPQGSAIWLKELQMKQEELIQKRKIQEERLKRHKQMNESPPGSHALNCNQYGISERDIEDSLSQIWSKVEGETNNSGPIGNELSFAIHQNTLSEKQLLEADQPNSVKYLASKFEKIMKPLLLASETAVVNCESGLQCGEKSPVLSGTSESPSSTHSSCEPSSNHTQSQDSLLHKDILPSRESEREKITSQKQSPHSAKMCTYNSHLTDGQLTNMLRIGANCSSLRSTNPSNTKDTSRTSVTSVSRSDVAATRTESRRPDKPPDYETAIQRLELIRGDRNHMRHFDINRFLYIDDSVLEEGKKVRSPKKSVTFSDKVVLVACAGDEDNDFLPNPLFERVYKQHIMQNTSSDPNAKAIAEEVRNTHDNSVPSSTQNGDTMKNSRLKCSDTVQALCNLCHNKIVSPPNVYCPDCAFYMSRFQK